MRYLWFLFICLAILVAPLFVAPLFAAPIMPPRTTSITHTDGTQLSRIIDEMRNHYGSRPSNWFRGTTLSGKKLAIVGDSTSDQTGNAAGLYTELAKYTRAGQPLAGVIVQDYGASGNTIQGFITGTGTTGKHYADVVADAPDAIVLSYGINDVRLGLRSEAQIQADLKTLITNFRRDLPNTDIILRIPNPLGQEDTGAAHYVQTAGGVIVDQATNANGSVAQTYSNSLYQAYKAQENLWPNVVLMDTWVSLFGSTSPLTSASSGYLSDQLHPGNFYPQIARMIVGYLVPADPATRLMPGYVDVNGKMTNGYSQAQSDRAQLANPSQPWVVYPRALEDPNYYDLIAEGRISGSLAATAFNFSWPGVRAGEINVGDIFLFYADNAVWTTSSTTGFSSSNNGNVQTLIGYTTGQGPTTASGNTDLVRVFRPKYYGDKTNVQNYVQNIATYPYQWRFLCNASGNGFLDMITPSSTNPILNGGVPTVTRRSIATGDTIVIPGFSAYVVPSTATFSTSQGYIAMSVAGTDFTGRTGLYGYVLSSRSPDTAAKGQVPINLGSVPGTALAVSTTPLARAVITRSSRFNLIWGYLQTAGTGGATTVTISVRAGGTGAATVGATLTFASGGKVATISYAAGSQIYCWPGDVISIEVTAITGTPSDLNVGLDVN